MKVKLTALGLVYLFLAGFAFSQSSNYHFESLLYDFELPQSNSWGLHGVAVAPDGNIWLALHGGLHNEVVYNSQDDSIGMYRPIYILDPDGNHVSFSPLKILELPGGIRDTLHSGSQHNGSGKGISVDQNGNILYTAWSTLYRINYQTGAGMNRFTPSDMSSMTEAVQDANGLIYLGYVVNQNRPVYLLDDNFNLLGNAIDNLGYINRTFAVTPDGKDLYSGSTWDGFGIVHWHSDLPGVLQYNSVDTLGNWDVVYDPVKDEYYYDVKLWASCLDWGPNGLLWAGNLRPDWSGPKGGMYYAFDVSTGAIVDSVGIALGDSSAGGIYSPRGAAWSQDGKTMYLADYDYNVVGIWKASECFPPAIKISPDILYSTTGNNLEFAVEIEANPQIIDALGFKLSYCLEKLTLLEVAKGDLTSHFQFFQSTELTPGTVTIGAFDLTAIPVNSSGSIAKFKFQVNQCEIGEKCPITIHGIVDDLAGLNICNAVFNCDYACLLGDVNMDQALSPGDALCAFQIYISGGVPTAECTNRCTFEAADANCDGSITSDDALTIFMAYLQNLPLPLQCPVQSNLAKTTKPVTLSLAQLKQTNPAELQFAIQVDRPEGLQAIALDLCYPVELLSFLKVTETSLTENWQALDGKENVPGVITIGGFNPAAIEENATGAIVLVSFKIKSDIPRAGDLWLTNVTDDLAGAQLQSIKINTAALDGEPEENLNLPDSYVLEQNYPNPFNLNTEIIYQIPEAGFVKLEIYNAIGQKIRMLVSQEQAAGRYAARWDGRDEQGLEVTSGIYFYRLVSSEFSQMRKMLLIK